MTQQIEPYIEQGRIALQEGKTLSEVRDAMAAPYHPDVARTEALPFPPVPAPVEITEEVADALKRLPEVFAVVQPTERRTLTDEEKVAVYEERAVLKHIAGLLEARDGHLKTIIRHHMDVDAEERGVAVPKAQVDLATGQVIVEATDRTEDGHYILCAAQQPERCPVPGTNQEWSREYRKGAVTTDAARLDEMAETGEIDREVYLAMTREKRVFDEHKARAAALEKPALRDQILRVVGAMTRQGKPSVSLYNRKAR